MPGYRALPWNLFYRWGCREKGRCRVTLLANPLSIRFVAFLASGPFRGKARAFPM
jgi:hypothetical protein